MKLPTSTSRRLSKRKKQILADRYKRGLASRYKQAGFLSFFIFIILIVAGVVAIFIYSDQAKPGDILYPVDLTIEDMQESFTTITPEDKIPVLVSQSKERILEASELSSDLNDDYNFIQALDKYKTSVPEIAYELNEGRARSRDIYNVEPLYIVSLLDNLRSLDKMYDQIHLQQQPTLDAAVVLTVQSYNYEIQVLSQRRKDLDLAEYRERFYELQQDFRTKGVIVE